MKVLQVTTNYPTKSNPIFGIFMKEQVESLEPLGVENTIFFSNGSESKVRKNHGGKWVHLKSVFKLSWHLLTHKYDLIHCHSVLSGLILLLSGGAFFNKCVISFQNDPEQNMDGRFFKILYPFFNAIIVKKPTRYLSRPKMYYQPNGVNTTFFTPLNKTECKQKLNLDINKRYILFVDSNTGKNRTQKRKDRFDETMQILRNEYNHTNIEELVMIGVSREDVPIWMNACDLHILSSDQEGSPNSVKECICCNVPVVATNVGNVEDLLFMVEKCYVDYDFMPSNIACLANKSLSNKNDSNIRQSIFQNRLDIFNVAQNIVNIYNSII